jgi:hypothetical protein
MNRAFSPEILVKESWAVGPGWNETGLRPYVTTVSKLAKPQHEAGTLVHWRMTLPLAGPNGLHSKPG